MITEVNNGKIMPRYYQIENDRIEAKQSSEPLSILHGPGPIVGYNVIKPQAAKFTLQSTSSIDDNNLLQLFGNFDGVQRNYLAVNNISGKVSNAHITASGLLSIDPDELVFNNIDLTWPITNICKIIAVKAQLVYPEEPIVAPPSINNFTATEIIGWTLEGTQAHAPLISALDMKTLLMELQARGFTINQNTEVLIGVYQLGYTEAQALTHKDYYDTFGYLIPMVPYGSRWPARYPFGIKQVLSMLALRKDLDNLEVTSEMLQDGSVTSPKIATGAITEDKMGYNYYPYSNTRIKPFSIEVYVNTNTAIPDVTVSIRMGAVEPAVYSIVHDTESPLIIAAMHNYKVGVNMGVKVVEGSTMVTGLVEYNGLFTSIVDTGAPGNSNTLTLICQSVKPSSTWGFRITGLFEEPIP